MTTALKTKVNQQDLKIYPSERLTQTDDGGGMPLGTPKVPTSYPSPSHLLLVSMGRFMPCLSMGVLRADDEPLIGAFAVNHQAA